MKLLDRLVAKGPRGIWQALELRAQRLGHRWRTRSAPRYRPPDAQQLLAIEAGARALGMPSADLRIDPAAFDRFCATFAFPAHYHGGEQGGVWREKLLEHSVAWTLLDLEHDAARWPYVDIAAATSPWVGLLRDRGYEAWAIDLEPAVDPAHAAYCLRGDATASPFEAGSIGSASLQCAFELFEGDADIRLMAELGRVLKPGGRAVISPLYTHVQPCYYQTPEHYGRDGGDPGALRLLRTDVWNVRASRKYSPDTLLSRVWDPARRAGLQPGLHVLRNAAELGPGLYLHFVLTLDRVGP